MATRRFAEIHCDRCDRAAELTPSHADGRQGGPRNVKPVGWARISISMKVDLSKPVEVVKAADLCPECVPAINELLEGITP